MHRRVVAQYLGSHVGIFLRRIQSEQHLTLANHVVVAPPLAFIVTAENGLEPVPDRSSNVSRTYGVRRVGPGVHGPSGDVDVIFCECVCREFRRRGFGVSEVAKRGNDGGFGIHRYPVLLPLVVLRGTREGLCVINPGYVKKRRYPQKSINNPGLCRFGDPYTVDSLFRRDPGVNGGGLGQRDGVNPAAERPVNRPGAGWVRCPGLS